MNELSQPREEMMTPPVAAIGAEPAESKAERYRWLKSVPRPLTLSEGNLFLILAIVIGIFSGIAVVCFRISIDWIRVALFGSTLTPSPARVLLVPAGVGLLGGFLIQRFFRGARGSGVNQTKAAVYVFDGYVPFRTVIGKFVTCALAICSGQSP